MVVEYHKRKRRLKARPTLTSETQRTIRTLIITLGIMIFTLTITFFITTNESAQRGYTLEQLKLENEYLRDQSDAINTRITQSTSFAEIDEKDSVDEMTEAETKIFITPEDNLIPD